MSFRESSHFQQSMSATGSFTGSFAGIITGSIETASAGTNPFVAADNITLIKQAAGTGLIRLESSGSGVTKLKLGSSGEIAGEQSVFRIDGVARELHLQTDEGAGQDVVIGGDLDIGAGANLGARLSITNNATTILNMKNAAATSGSQAWSLRIASDGKLELRSIQDASNTTVFAALTVTHADGTVDLNGDLNVDGEATFSVGVTQAANQNIGFVRRERVAFAQAAGSGSWFRVAVRSGSTGRGASRIIVTSFGGSDTPTYNEFIWASDWNGRNSIQQVAGFDIGELGGVRAVCGSNAAFTAFDVGFNGSVNSNTFVTVYNDDSFGNTHAQAVPFEGVSPSGAFGDNINCVYTVNDGAASRYLGFTKPGFADATFYVDELGDAFFAGDVTISGTLNINLTEITASNLLVGTAITGSETFKVSGSGARVSHTVVELFVLSDSGSLNDVEIGPAGLVLFNGTVGSTITGFVGGVTGRELKFLNGSGGSVNLARLSGSTPINQLFLSGSADIVLNNLESCTFVHLSNRWFIVGGIVKS